jgi:hypothetical protein
MAYQARYDGQLKFKQIDLEKNIIDLFVDVPARVMAPPGAERDARWADKPDRTVHRQVLPDAASVRPDEAQLAQATGALQLLASSDFARQFPKVVIEGAPGQGKSTVTQYLCQIHRLLLLNRKDELSRAADVHKPSEARIPFRIDIRDYALWIAGRDPFGDDPSVRLPPGSNPVLESFLAGQVQRYTGTQFDADDLVAVVGASQVLIVLDGFDEVADVILRNRIVKEVSDAAARTQENALSAQIIVTSRPAAFANSPGFPADEWQHVQILALSRTAIQAYAGKWLDGRGADAREKRTVLNALTEKLNQAHVRELARNPMQLAILLALISVQGASLPDKRTALYDKYIDIFLNREAEKSVIVRDYREHLIQIHQYLAWILQVDAETNSGAGHIAEARLRETVRGFLEQRGHPTTLADQLFSGMVERVVALVSRVQGTYEFEVQPLREYFAARFLHDTAPYDPTGTPRRGTLPERFGAIARNFYWLNVARFYAGCYSSGELASLLVGIDDIGSSEQFRYISHIPQLAVTLLSDYVFGQQPRLALTLASRVTTDAVLRHLLAYRYARRADGPLTLPSGPARIALVEACRQLLTKTRQNDTLFALCEVLPTNCTREEVFTIWNDLRAILHDDTWWVQIARPLGIFSSIRPEECASLLSNQRQAITQEIWQHGRMDILELHPELWKPLLEDVLDDTTRLFLFDRGPQTTGYTSQIFYFSAIFSGGLCEEIPEAPDDWSVARLIDLMTHSRGTEDRSGRLLSGSGDGELIPQEFVTKLCEFLDTPLGNLKSSVLPWSELIESARLTWGERWSLCRMAVSATQITGAKAIVDCSLSDRTVPLCDRVARARQAAGDRQWWLAELARAQDIDVLALQFTIYALQRCVPIEDISRLSKELGIALDELPTEHWPRIADPAAEAQAYRSGRRGRERHQINKTALPSAMSPRLACLLMLRAHHSSAQFIRDRFLAHYRGNDRAVLGAIVEVVTERAFGESKTWSAALPEIAYAYTHNVVYTGIFPSTIP